LRRKTTNEHSRNHKDRPTSQLISSLSVREAREQGANGLHNKEAAAATLASSAELQSHEEEHAARRDPLGPGKCLYYTSRVRFTVSVTVSRHGVRYVCAVLTSIVFCRGFTSACSAACSPTCSPTCSSTCLASKEVSCPGGP